MPYRLRPDAPECPADRPWAVENQQTGQRMGCHPSRRKAVAQLRALYAEEDRASQEAASMHLIHGVVSPDAVAELAGDGVIRGIASTVGNVDRAKRVFLPGAFGTEPKRVPLLAFHDAQRPIGSSLLTPEGDTLRHESRLANLPAAQEFHELIKVGAIPATSIGWVDAGSYAGWNQLLRADPLLAKRAEAMGVARREDCTYYARAEIVENSLVPIPSNPMALLQVAAMLRAGGENDALIEDLYAMAQLQPRPTRRMRPRIHRAQPQGGGTSVEVRRAIGRIDAAVDDAMSAADDDDMDQVKSSLTTADNAIDGLMKALDIPDPDEQGAARFWQTAAGSRHNATDQADIQHAHDCMTKLGANCTGPKGPPQQAAGSRHSQADMDMIQSAHDSMARLGANCTGPKGPPVGGPPRKRQGASWKDEMHSLVHRIVEEEPDIDPETVTSELNALLIEIAGVLPSHKTATDDGAWKDQSGRMTNSEATFRQAFAYLGDGDPTSFRSYSYFHHFIDANGSVGAASTQHCSQLIGVLNGGRGGTVLSGSDRSGVYNHLARHLRDAGKDVPPLNGAAADGDNSQVPVVSEPHNLSDPALIDLEASLRQLT